MQSAVNARRQGEENPNSSVIAETMKLIQKARMAIKLWIAVTMQIQSIQMMKGHLQPSPIKYSRDWAMSTVNFTR